MVRGDTLSSLDARFSCRPSVMCDLLWHACCSEHLLFCLAGSALYIHAVTAPAAWCHPLQPCLPASVPYTFPAPSCHHLASSVYNMLPSPYILPSAFTLCWLPVFCLPACSTRSYALDSSFIPYLLPSFLPCRAPPLCLLPIPPTYYILKTFYTLSPSHFFRLYYYLLPTFLSFSAPLFSWLHTSYLCFIPTITPTFLP